MENQPSRNFTNHWLTHLVSRCRVIVDENSNSQTVSEKIITFINNFQSNVNSQRCINLIKQQSDNWMRCNHKCESHTSGA